MRKTKGHGIFRSYCRACERLRRRKHEKARPDLKQASDRRSLLKARKLLQEKYEIILETNAVAFKPLSEPQWIETCQHFGGCAICGADNIEARSFFVPFEQGGKYAVWNIFPVCGACGVKIRIFYNPLKWVKGMQAKTMGINKKRAKKLVDFMMDQLEKVEK